METTAGQLARRRMNVPRTVRLLLGSIAFVIAFSAACLAIREALPFRYIPAVRSKLRHFQQRGNDFDALFVGSSRIQYQVIPAMFDEVARNAGVPVKSFNAGVAGMRPPEDAFLFDQLLAARPQRLRWVFIELGYVRFDIPEERRGTMRAQYWHDVPRLWVLWQRVTELKPTDKPRSLKRVWRELRDPLGEFPQHLELFFREMSNLGRGDFLSRRLLYAPRKLDARLPVELGPDLAGWTETGRGEEMTPENRARFEQELAERLVTPAVRDVGDRVSQEALEAMIAKVERIGATPVLVAAPMGGRRYFFPRPERAQRTLVLDFNDPHRFPELFEVRHRLDTDHLNTAGSRLFTRLLAEQWIAHLNAREQGR